MERLTVGVKCHECNRTTRNISGYCQDHGRNNRNANQVASVSGALLNVRLPEVQRLQRANPEAMEEITKLGAYLVSSRPTVLVDNINGTVNIKNSFSSTNLPDSLFWNGAAQEFHSGEVLEAGDATFLRAGSDLVVHPKVDLPLDRKAQVLEQIQVEAFNSAETLRQFNASRNDLEVKSESYDDKAEILAQLRLAGNDATALRYSAPEDGKIIVSVKSPANPDVIERWTLARSIGAKDASFAVTEFGYRYNVVGDGELVSRRTKKKIADSIPESARADRSELIGNIIEAIETIDKHAVTMNGKVHLPIGWTD